MERSKTWHVAIAMFGLGIGLLANGWIFTGVVLILLGCVLKLVD